MRKNVPKFYITRLAWRLIERVVDACTKGCMTCDYEVLCSRP